MPSDQHDAVHRARGVRFATELGPEQLADVLDRHTALFTSLSEATYATRLRSLADKARTIVEETGANNLYLALGTLVWSVDGKDLRSSLVLVPISLTTRARTAAYRIELDDSGTSTAQLLPAR